MPEELEDELRIKVELIELEDFPGLVAYLEGIVARCPDDAYAVRDLGEACHADAVSTVCSVGLPSPSSNVPSWLEGRPCWHAVVRHKGRGSP